MSLPNYRLVKRTLNKAHVDVIKAVRPPNLMSYGSGDKTLLPRHLVEQCRMYAVVQAIANEMGGIAWA